MNNSKKNLPSYTQVARAITIHEPHSWLIVSDFIKPGYCVKPVENRGWPTSFRGPVAIHAGSPMHEVFDLELGQWLWDLHPKIAKQLNLPAISDNPAESSIFHPGCILGVVEVFDCLRFDPDTQDFREVCYAAGHREWYDAHPIEPAQFASGEWCHLLRRPAQFTQPWPCRGALNYWRLESRDGALAAVFNGLRKPLGSPYLYRKQQSQPGLSVVD